jgi:hypothetical protein
MKEFGWMSIKHLPNTVCKTQAMFSRRQEFEDAKGGTILVWWKLDDSI